MIEETKKHWYVIHTYSGYEDRVKMNLEHRIQNMDVKDNISQVIIPTEEEIEIKNGQRTKVAKKVFPGYILIEMELTDGSWYTVRNTPGVIGFVGTGPGSKPTPLDDQEAKTILKQMEAEAPRIKVGIDRGQSVRIIDGPFIDFIGVVDEINAEKGKVRVLVSFFGRETPVELDLLQIEKL
jgi:transcriptional antiterminator NusG